MEEMKFEDAMQELENIASNLEKGDLSLDESITKFEEGMKLAKKCNQIIEEAEKKITMLVSKDGKLEEETFNQDE